jgi:hypothetical protein
MKTIIILLASFFLFGVYSVQAQDENKQSKKETKKAERKAEDERNYVLTGNLLDSMKFVLEASYLSNQYGNRVIVSNNINFIQVDSTHAILQIGRNAGVGNNGVGGTTVEGRVSNYEVTRNEKKKSYFVSMNIMSVVGAYDVFIDVNGNGSALATISGSTSGKLNWEGDIVALNESRVYKGRSL